MSPRYVPVDISQPAFRLNGEMQYILPNQSTDSFFSKGHKSIVNSAVIHPSFLHIVTSGVERDIVLHGTAPSSPCTFGMDLTDTRERQLPPSAPGDRERMLLALRTAREFDRESAEELETIALFDQ